MSNGFDLRCGVAKTARVWLQRKGDALKPRQAFVLLPVKEGETEESPEGYLAPLQEALIDKNKRHVNVVVCDRITARSSARLSICRRLCSSQQPRSHRTIKAANGKSVIYGSLPSALATTLSPCSGKRRPAPRTNLESASSPRRTGTLRRTPEHERRPQQARYLAAGGQGPGGDSRRESHRAAASRGL
jgi:ribosomal protein L40E